MSAATPNSPTLREWAQGIVGPVSGDTGPAGGVGRVNDPYASRLYTTLTVSAVGSTA